MQNYLSTTWRLWKLLKPFHKDFGIQFTAIIIQQLAQVTAVYLMAKVLDNIVNKDFHQAYIYVAFFFSLRIAAVVVNYFSDLHNNKNITYQIQQFLERYSFEHIFKLNPSQYIEDHSAVKMQVIDRGEKSVEDIVKMTTLTLVPIATQLILFLGAIAIYSPFIAMFVAGTFFVVLIWSNRFANFHREFVRKDRDNWDEQRKIRTEAFQHLGLIKLSAVEKQFSLEYLMNRAKYIAYTIRTWRLRINHGYKRWSLLLASRIVTMSYLVYQASISSIGIGAIYAVWSYLNDIYSNISNIIQAMRDLPLRFVELEKYLRIIDKQPDFEEEGAGKFVSGDIVFKDLNFKYPKSEGSVLKNLSLTIPQGKKVAFVGVSGSGKSTIIKLLLRMYDYQDGSLSINNLELKDMSASDLRHHIGYVEQHVDLFDTTVRENLLFGLTDKNVSEEFLNEVVKKARIDQFFHRLSKGLETQIGERGVKLSGGERQRLGIARALIKNPEILIFDEATASLDTENEKYIQEAIDEASRDRTSIIIAHRLSTIQNADVIFVMHHGELVGSGTHQDLLQSNGYYQNLTKHQS
jgi:ABC-type multidrug transport system fused ATPase/permease subunit